jgi:hypothetical protein
MRFLREQVLEDNFPTLRHSQFGAGRRCEVFLIGGNSGIK